MFKVDGTQWYNFFQIRQDDCGNYYFAWLGTKRSAFPDDTWRSTENMKRWIMEQDWKRLVDEEFEREVLFGSEER